MYSQASCVYSAATHHATNISLISTKLGQNHVPCPPLHESNSKWVVGSSMSWMKGDELMERTRGQWWSSWAFSEGKIGEKGKSLSMVKGLGRGVCNLWQESLEKFKIATLNYVIYIVSFYLIGNIKNKKYNLLFIRKFKKTL